MNPSAASMGFRHHIVVTTLLICSTGCNSCFDTDAYLAEHRLSDVPDEGMFDGASPEVGDGSVLDPEDGAQPTICSEVLTIEIGGHDADVMGWDKRQSMFGEGDILVPCGAGASECDPPEDPLDATAAFKVEIPCRDTWRIWVRGFDGGRDDAFRVRLDGEPADPPIFELACGGGGGGYRWAELRSRPFDSERCADQDTPWRPEWSAGEHVIQFMPSSSDALARLIVTNDPDFTQ